MTKGSRTNAQHSRQLLYTLYTGILVLASMLMIEVGLRLAYAFLVGPDVLLYGITRYYSASLLKGGDDEATHSVQFHDNVMRGYTKYLPHQTRMDHDEHGASFQVTINGQGFRGRDFAQDKPSGTLRVATLGASSTFGYSDRDDETYPSFLERELNTAGAVGACGARTSYEVLNFGVPHLRARNILHLLRNEVLAYSPDVITFYEGINDSADMTDVLLRPRSPSLGLRLFETAGNRLIAMGLVRSIYEARRRSRGFGLDDVRRTAAASDFMENLEAIRVEAEKRGITLVVASQQAKSSPGREESLRGVRYEDEVRGIQAQLMNGGGLRANEVVLLLHNELMSELRQWASARGVAFVDIIERTNDRRDLLVSWVHLSPEANKAIARALASAIQKDRCDRGPGARSDGEASRR